MIWITNQGRMTRTRLHLQAERRDPLLRPKPPITEPTYAPFTYLTAEHHLLFFRKLCLYTVLVSMFSLHRTNSTLAEVAPRSS
jgi:hypothetical protein